MGKKLTLEEIINRANIIHNNLYDYSLITDYKGVMEKYPVICNIHGVWNVSLDNHVGKKSTCPKCSGRDFTYLEKIEQGKKIHNNLYDYSNIKNNFGTMDKVSIICKIHGNFIQLWTNHIHQKQGCPKCKNHRKPISIEQYKEKVKEINLGYEYDWDSYDGHFSNKFRIKCPSHGWFNQQLSNHLQGQRCPKCSYSKGEESIELFLKENNIQYINQKTFHGCINPNTNKKLKFDFYLPKHNLCIEYDGELHYKPVEFFGGIENFEKQQYLDELKNQYCKNNKISLIRIAYFDYKSLNNILTKILK